MKCDLCKHESTNLTLIDFKNIIWRQGETFQAIKKNIYLINLRDYILYLCSDCRHKIFDTSNPCINFNQDLISALSKGVR